MNKGLFSNEVRKSGLVMQTVGQSLVTPPSFTVDSPGCTTTVSFDGGSPAPAAGSYLRARWEGDTLYLLHYDGTNYLFRKSTDFVNWTIGTTVSPINFLDPLNLIWTGSVWWYPQSGQSTPDLLTGTWGSSPVGSMGILNPANGKVSFASSTNFWNTSTHGGSASTSANAIGTANGVYCGGYNAAGTFVYLRIKANVYPTFVGLASSTDGLAYSENSFPNAFANPVSMTWAPWGVSVLDADGSIYMTSDLGATWTRAYPNTVVGGGTGAAPASSTTTSYIATWNGTYAMFASNRLMISSPDGITWTARKLYADSLSTTGTTAQQTNVFFRNGYPEGYYADLASSAMRRAVFDPTVQELVYIQE